MSIFLRKLWYNKPKQYGPWSFVHHSLIENCEKLLSLSSENIVLAIPFWNSGKTINYGKVALESDVHGAKYRNGSMYFDGISTRYYSFPDHASQDTGSEITLISRVNHEAIVSGVGLINHDNSNYKYLLYSTSSGRLLYIRTSSGVTSTAVENSTVLNEWHTWTGVYDRYEPANNRLKLYFDSDLAQTATGYDQDILAGDEGILLGKFDANELKGYYDLALVFNKALDQERTALISENPWALWQQIQTVFYSVPAVVKVETPVILPTSGAYPASQSISMSCATSGASIYYTEDGSTPDSGDTLYSAPFTLGSAKTIKAIGIKAGLTDSDVATEVYTIAAIATQPIITIMT